MQQQQAILAQHASMTQMPPSAYAGAGAAMEAATRCERQGSVHKGSTVWGQGTSCPFQQDWFILLACLSTCSCSAI